MGDVISYHQLGWVLFPLLAVALVLAAVTVLPTVSGLEGVVSIRLWNRYQHQAYPFHAF